MRSCIKFFCVLIICLGLSNVGHPLTRGYLPGELYFSSTWYWVDIGERYDAMFFSNDHGETLHIIYICDIDAGDMQPFSLIRDAAPGYFYNIQPTKLWRSQDYCTTWEDLVPAGESSTYSSGVTPGEVYKVWTNEAQWRVELHRSTDYGGSFQLINENISGKSEVGTEPGEVYHYHLWQQDSIYLKINLSTDSGTSFNVYHVHDTSICGIVLMGHYPSIYHGVEPGELYLVSWHLPENFKIFYSTDYGQNFNLRFASPICDFYYESYTFTPGVEAGEFYYIKTLPWFDGINTRVHIFHSSDTAKTFIEYIHVLDSTFPVVISEPNIQQKDLFNISNYPNPFNNQTTISFQMPVSAACSIELVNLSGQAVLRKEEFFDTGKHTIKLQTGHLAPGVYLCSIKCQGKVLGVSKMVKGR
ncbi:MAG: T9SS type A sorting domain-containing protein [Bacteroidetes bacterium]|nr:T9SS type A sorting domain-containing protein [Bacteroidota bacterium]